MKIDYQNVSMDLSTVAGLARRVEASGYDGLWTAETSHDPFLPHVLAAEHTEHLEIGTGIAVAFARNPMTVAHLGWDLQAFSRGRFILGLGSQVKPHIRLRFSMEWSRPAARMNEFIAALHAIWDSWENGTPLRFRGDFYTHVLMTPFFNPGPNPHGRAKIFVAAVGEKMVHTAATAADGLLAHAFTTERYIRDVTLPTVESALATSGRPRSDFQISIPVFVVTGATAEEFDHSKRYVKQQIAFYGSTPAYAGVLDHHGWGEVHSELNALSKRGEWDHMAEAIDDEVLEAFAVVGEPHAAGAAIAERFGDVADRISLYTKRGRHDEAVIREVVAAVRG